MGVKKTTEEFIADAIAKHGEKFDYSKTVYLTAKKHVTIICKIHGEFDQIASDHLRGSGCPECANNKKRDTTWFIPEAIAVHGGRYQYDKSKFNGMYEKITVTCQTHGDFVTTPAVHLKGHICKSCYHDSTRVGTEDFLLRAFKTHGNRYDYSKVNFSVLKEKVVILCSQHGEFSQVAQRHLEGSQCPKCAEESMRLTKVEYIQKALVKHEGKYTYRNLEYVSHPSKIVATCDKHGDFSQNSNNHLRGWGCPKCTNTISSYEKQILSDFPEFEQVNRTIIYPQHLDLYSAEHNIAIEVDGVYWHSEAKGKDNKYHLSKTERCLEQGIELLHFWDYEVKTKYEVIQSMLSARLNKNSKIFARKCSVEIINTDEANIFMRLNHLQSDATHKIAIGLFYNGELVSAMTFGKPRFNKKVDWEMIRFATKLGVTVVGGASKLFSAFVTKYTPKSIISYSDRRYSNGKVYGKLGFSLVGTSPPNYFYWKNGRRLSRYQAQKHKLPKLLTDKFDSSKTELENMINAGYTRVFDCGNLVYTWAA